MDYEWHEVWTNEATPNVYLLLVLPDSGRPGGVLILDPKASDSIVFRAKNYEDAQLWLLEDEFICADGRMMTDLPFPNARVADR